MVGEIFSDRARSCGRLFSRGDDVINSAEEDKSWQQLLTSEKTEDVNGSVDR